MSKRGRKPLPPSDQERKYLRLVRDGATAAVENAVPDAAPDAETDEGADIAVEIDPALAAPKHLKPMAAEIWAFLIGELSRRGTVETIDVISLELLANAVQDYRELYAFFDQPDPARTDGRPRGRTYVVTGRNGSQIKPRPEVAMLNAAIVVINKIGSDFGLSPVARLRLRDGDAGGLDDEGGLFDAVR